MGEPKNLALVPAQEEVARHLIQSDDANKWLTSVMIQACREIAKAEGIPLSGLTVLGGKVYVNVTGLDAKLNDLCKERKFEKAVIEVQEIRSFDAEDGRTFRVGFQGVVKLFDKTGYMEALKLVKGKSENITVEMLKELKEQFTYTYIDEGWASQESIKMSTMKNQDFVRMMASRRASNRAKRAATSVGLTSVEEIGTDMREVMVEPSGGIQREGQAAAGPQRVVFVTWKKDGSAEVSGFLLPISSKLPGMGGKLTDNQRSWIIPGPSVQGLTVLCEMNSIEVREAQEGTYSVEKSVPLPPEPEPETDDKTMPVIFGITGPSQSASGKFWKVQWGKTSYWCWSATLVEYMQKGIGKRANLTIDEKNKKFPTIAGILQIGRRQFTNNVPDLDVNDDPKNITY